MKNAIFAGALALVLFGFAPAFNGPVQATETDAYGSSNQASINLNRIKTVLRLSPAQQSYWPPVEAALTDIAREQAGPSGYFTRIKRGIIGITLNSGALMRLASAARPLIESLDERQRQAVRALAREMGMGAMVAAL